MQAIFNLRGLFEGCSFSSLTDDTESLSRFLANYKGDIKSGTQAYVTSISRWYAECKDEERFADIIVMKAKLEGRPPSASELAVLCQTYGRKSDKLKRICDTICDHIKDECKHIVNVWPSYRPREENIIVFCVITDFPCERIICPYSVVQRAIGEYSIEEREILKQELNRGLDFTDDAVERCIEKNADKFMDNHKNLSVMSASLLKSEKFGTSLEKVSQQVCIVLLVPVKGLIPLSEEAFPKFIVNFPVDVREGNFRYKFGGKPNDRHESLKMGCAIHGDEPGTLGGFLDHNEHGICCLTVAHVMLNVPKMKRTFPGQYIPESSELCYQPEPPNAFGYLIKAIAIEGNEDKPGIDVALVKIDERIPLSGRFPDAETEKLLEAGYSSTLEMQYDTGEVFERSEIPRGKLVLKYGQATTLTEGVVRLRGFAVRNVNFYDNSEGYKYILTKQIQVRHIKDAPFSEDGDSGSLVFVKRNDGRLVAIGMLVGGTDSYDVVTPICDILRELDTALSLKQFP
ncbi:uncharacterized protein LOC128552915 isoform X2 [Mercenaria mercenaria]|uniref:uncharacterized protein LOC128552915 isoform X2 n=1 Tax=Mercenaria mercenaria TaxID=6596 RepID=UPI00234F6608|nr:uncharacterized protein LOC128552915 isoform X2 [Mercenaria mercenaria]